MTLDVALWLRLRCCFPVWKGLQITAAGDDRSLFTLCTVTQRDTGQAAGFRPVLLFVLDRSLFCCAVSILYVASRAVVLKLFWPKTHSPPLIFLTYSFLNHFMYFTYIFIYLYVYPFLHNYSNYIKWHWMMILFLLLSDRIHLNSFLSNSTLPKYIHQI